MVSDGWRVRLPGRASERKVCGQRGSPPGRGRNRAEGALAGAPGCARHGGGSARRGRGRRCRPRMVRTGAEWSHAGAEGVRAGAEHVSLPETGIRNSYAPEVHYTLTPVHIARHGADSAWICPSRAPRHCLARSRGRYAVVRPLLLKLLLRSLELTIEAGRSLVSRLHFTF